MKSKWAWRAPLYIVSVIVLIIAAYPMYYVLIASFSNANALANGEVWIVPKDIYLTGYKRIFEYQPLWIGYRNTIVYTLVGTALALVVTLPAAYAMSRRDMMLKKPIMIYFTITMFFSGGMIPMYLLIKNIGLLDNPLVMVLPGCFSVYNMIIARTYFDSTIPRELQEAASLDGCGNLRFFVAMVLPLSRAIVAVIGLYVAVGIWNSYFDALLYLKNKQLVPLQLALRDILIANSFNERVGAGSATSGMEQQQMRDLVKYCVIVLSTFPIMCVYPFLQKYFAKGVMIGSVKG